MHKCMLKLVHAFQLTNFAYILIDQIPHVYYFHAICALSMNYLFSLFFSDLSVARPYLLYVVPNQRIFHFLFQWHKKILMFISDLMDYFLAGVDQQQIYQPNGLADGQP